MTSLRRAENPWRAPLPYLAMKQTWGLDVDLSVQWNGHEVSRAPIERCAGHLPRCSLT